MKLTKLFFILVLISLAMPVMAQKKKNKGGGTKMFVRGKSRSDYFGERNAPKKIMKNKTDKVRPFGLQAQLGATTTLVNADARNTKNDITPYGGNYEINPLTRVGIYGEIGFVHMNMRATTARKKIIDYLDYGIGFKLFRGAEKITLSNIPYGNALENGSETSSFQLGNLHARFGVHKLQYLTKKKKLFIDHSLGINFDYRITERTNQSALSSNFPQKYSGNYALMLHYDVGLGIRLGKGKYLVVGVQTPFVEFLGKPMGNPSFNWLSSSYYPFLIRVKYIHLFPAKKSKHACWMGDDEQRKMNEQYMQGQ